MKVIKFSYQEKQVDDITAKNIIVEFDGTKKELNLEKECLNEISSLNNFILENVADNEELSFQGENSTYENNQVIKEIIEKIINIYEKEYNEVIRIVNKIIDTDDLIK